MKKIILIFFFVLLLIPLSLAQEDVVDLYVFYGQGCPHCSKMLTFLDSIEDKHPELNVTEFEVYFNPDNADLFIEMSEAYNTKVGGVPTVFIDEKIIVGFSNSLAESLEQEIQRCIEIKCESPIQKLENSFEPTEEMVKIEGDSSPSEDPEKTELKETITLPAVIGAAFVDAINPCAFAVLIILLTTILASEVRKRALFAGIVFTLSIFISYFLMGLGLYSAIQAAGVSHIFYSIVAVLAILIGLFNLKDYLWYGKWFIMEVPLSWRPKMKSLIRSVTSIPGAFLIGFVVSLFLLPCTSGPYIVILGLLAKAATKNYALLLLLLYNFIFVMPMLLITLAVYFGFTTVEKAEEWRKTKLKLLHLIAGIIILLLGIGMIIALCLGLV